MSDVLPYFQHFKSSEMYENFGIKGYAPMTAKEIDTEEEQDKILSDSDYYIEEKFDGTRALLYFLSENPISKKAYSVDERNLRLMLQAHGSLFHDGNKRIYTYFLSNSSKTDRASFLKREFGIGGCSSDIENIFFADHDAKGYSIRYRDNREVLFSWSQVSDIISDMISKGEFFPSFGYTRCFSRRVSEKTGWYCENTDSLPHLRDINIPELRGTIIDGEMFIPNRPFKDVSSTLNCTWDKAVERQNELGKIVFHAFDILFYKGIDLRKMPLNRRKVYLQLVIDAVNSPYVEMVYYQQCGGKLTTSPYEKIHGLPEDVYRSLGDKVKFYPNFSKEVTEFKSKNHNNGNLHFLTPRAFYEYIVATNGEGVMVKPVKGRYYHKRGREYQKIKKFLTREVIIMGFSEPTEEYKGKFPTIESWNYWETTEHDFVDLSEYSTSERKKFKDTWYPHECAPVSKYYCKNWVGNIRFGVVITPEEANKLPKNKKFNIEELIIEGKNVLVIEVGECSGFDEETREMFSNNPKSWVGKVIEVKANELFKDTGKLRHPRYLRLREDKSPLDCIYSEHIG